MSHPRRPELFQPVLVARGDESRATRDRFDRTTSAAPLFSTGHAQGSIARSRTRHTLGASARPRGVDGDCWRAATSGASQPHFVIPPLTHEGCRSRAKHTSVLA